MSREPALLTSAGRMPERSQHRVSEGQDVRSERPATGHGQPRTATNAVKRGVSFSSRDAKRRLFPMDTALFNRSETIRARLLQLRDSL